MPREIYNDTPEPEVHWGGATRDELEWQRLIGQDRYDDRDAEDAWPQRPKIAPNQTLHKDSGKPPLELLSPTALIEIARVLDYGKGKWVLDKAKNDTIGFYAFESLRGIAEALMLDMARKAGQGINIGGGANIAFAVQGDGETLKISGSNMAHYGVAQSRMTDEVWESQKLPAQYIMWTSSVSKDEDGVSSGKVIGPDVIGKALTAEVPRWFHYSLRLDVLPAQQGKGERHLLYLGTHSDLGAGNAAALGNIRRPLDAPPLKELIIEPADIVKALQLIRDESNKAAMDVIKKRLEAK